MQTKPVYSIMNKSGFMADLLDLGGFFQRCLRQLILHAGKDDYISRISYCFYFFRLTFRNQICFAFLLKK